MSKKQITAEEFGQSKWDKGKKKLARPGSRFGAATTSNNNSGKGLKVYKGKNGTAAQARKNGKGLTVYIPRKRKPKVAFPKG